MARKLQTATLFFALQWVNYFLVVINGRAFTHLQYTATAASDFTICILQWTMLKQMLADDDWWSRAGFALGGASGSLFGMWLTKGWGA